MKILTRKMNNMWSTHCRGQNSIGQRQSLQVSHQAVGQESVDGCDLRGRSGLDWEKDMSVIQQRDSALNVFIHLLSLMGTSFIFLLFPVYQMSGMLRFLDIILWFANVRVHWCYVIEVSGVTFLFQSRKLREMKVLTIIKVEQRHFFFLFLALFLDRLWWRFSFSCLEGDERNTGMFGS